MPIEKVVINASPFILLSKSGLIELLPQLFSEIVMPERVSLEIIEGDDIATQTLYDYEASWLEDCFPIVSEEVLVWNLGDGETDVLSWAFQHMEDFTALIDDRAARNCAKALGIPMLGTGGILVLAKRRGLIESVGEALQKLQDAGLYISDDIVELLKKQAGEK